MQTNYTDHSRDVLQEFFENQIDLQRRVAENLADPEVESFTVTKGTPTVDQKEAARLGAMNRHQRRKDAAQYKQKPSPKHKNKHKKKR